MERLVAVSRAHRISTGFWNELSPRADVGLMKPSRHIMRRSMPTRRHASGFRPFLTCAGMRPPQEVPLRRATQSCPCLRGEATFGTMIAR